MTWRVAPPEWPELRLATGRSSARRHHCAMPRYIPESVPLTTRLRPSARSRSSQDSLFIPVQVVGMQEPVATNPAPTEAALGARGKFHDPQAGSRCTATGQPKEYADTSSQAGGEDDIVT